MALSAPSLLLLPCLLTIALFAAADSSDVNFRELNVSSLMLDESDVYARFVQIMESLPQNTAARKPQLARSLSSAPSPTGTTLAPSAVRCVLSAAFVLLATDAAVLL